METLSFVIGMISLMIAIIAEIRSMRLKQTIEIQLSQIRELNKSIIKRAYDGSKDPKMCISEIQALADTQKVSINSLFRMQKLRFWNDLWKDPGDPSIS